MQGCTRWFINLLLVEYIHMKIVVTVIISVVISFFFGTLYQRSVFEKLPIDSTVDCQESPALVSTVVSSIPSVNKSVGKVAVDVDANNIERDEKMVDLSVSQKKYNRMVSSFITSEFVNEVTKKAEENPEYNFMDKVEVAFKNESPHSDDRESREQNIYDIFYNNPILYNYPVGSVECRQTQCRVEIAIANDISADELSIELAESLSIDGDTVLINQKRNYETGEMYIYIARSDSPDDDSLPY